MKIEENVFFVSEQVSLFLQRNPKIPLCQRSYVEERIDYFYKKLESGNTYLGILHCALMTDKDQKVTTYLMDGQHRFFAKKKFLEEKGIDLGIQVVIVKCSTRESLVEFFKSLNNTFDLENLILDDFDRAEVLKKHILQNYRKHVSNSENPRYPNVNLDKITRFTLERCPDDRDVVKFFEKMNSELRDLLVDDAKFGNPKQGLYVAYLFITSEIAAKRSQIPKAVRDSLWNSNFPGRSSGACYVCDQVITVFNFHAGHIVSVKNGGPTKIGNLAPLCSDCNLSMGPMNIEEFKTKYF